MFLFLFGPNSAQNLVPNYSFEKYSSCPNGGLEIYLAQPWFSVSITADLYNRCDTSNNGVGVPKNGYGFRQPRTGDGYAGFYAIAPQFPITRKYVCVKLDSVLKAREEYCASFYVSLGDSCTIGVYSLGMYISNDTVYSATGALSNYTPQILNSSENFLIDKINWMLVSGTYLAKGGEQYITIGNFNNDANTITESAIGGADDWAYYYIDDVYVGDCIGEGIPPLSNALDFSVFPNPATTNLTIETSLDMYYSIRLFNLIGGLVFSKEQVTGKKAGIELNNLSKGVYFAELIETSTGLVGRKKIIVQ